MLTMAMTEIVSFNAVSNAKTKNLSQGCAFTAWANLEVIYKSKSNASQYDHCVLKTQNKIQMSGFLNWNQSRFN